MGSLCEFVLPVCPHNMNTESGFSRMKFAESQHQNCFLPETYDSVLIIQEVFSRDDFEKAFNFPAELCDTVRQAASEYKKSTESKVVENSRKRGHAEVLRVELHVFKRMTPLALKNQLNEVDSSIDEAKKALEALEKKKKLLHIQRTISVVTLDQQSAVVTESTFVKKSMV